MTEIFSKLGYIDSKLRVNHQYGKKLDCIGACWTLFQKCSQIVKNILFSFVELISIVIPFPIWPVLVLSNIMVMHDVHMDTLCRQC